MQMSGISYDMSPAAAAALRRFGDDGVLWSFTSCLLIKARCDDHSMVTDLYSVVAVSLIVCGLYRETSWYCRWFLGWKTPVMGNCTYIFAFYVSTSFCSISCIQQMTCVVWSARTKQLTIGTLASAFECADCQLLDQGWPNPRTWYLKRTYLL